MAKAKTASEKPSSLEISPPRQRKRCVTPTPLPASVFRRAVVIRRKY